MADITSLTELETSSGRMADAYLVRQDGFPEVLLSIGENSHSPVFIRTRHLRAHDDDGNAFAIDAPCGQTDLDEASAMLRVREAKCGHDEGVTRLILFRFPDLASLSGSSTGRIMSSRLFALALDEAALREELKCDNAMQPAPILHARARLVAEARASQCPSYLKPHWSDDEDRNQYLIRHAKADGFDGLIGPPAFASLVRNA